MIAWSDDLWQSVVLLTAEGEGRESKFGTGFVVCFVDGAAWVVTCAHVLDQLDPLGQADAVRVNNRPARLAGKPHPEIDLAVLHVPDLADAVPLALTRTTIPGSRAWIPGWHSVDRGLRRRDPLAATLGRKIDFSATGETIQHTFDLAVEGFADDTPFDVGRREKVIHPGYSGAPVLCPARRAVVAVASMEKEQGEAAYAVSVEHLPAVWPDDAPAIPWLDVPDRLLETDVCQFLAGLLGSLPQGLSLDDLKRHCTQCAPPGLPLDYPAGDAPTGSCIGSWRRASCPTAMSRSTMC